MFPTSGFLQIPPHGGHPCLRLYPSHYRADSGLSPVRNVRRRAHHKIKTFGHDQRAKSLYSCILFAILFWPFISNLQFDFYTSILSTQPYYLSILSTQLCYSICSLSLNSKEFDRIENTVKSHLNATNPLKSEPFHTPDFRPLTSTRHTQHVILRLFSKHIYKCKNTLFRGISTNSVSYLSSLLS